MPHDLSAGFTIEPRPIVLGTLGRILGDEPKITLTADPNDPNFYDYQWKVTNVATNTDAAIRDILDDPSADPEAPVLKLNLNKTTSAGARVLVPGNYKIQLTITDPNDPDTQLIATRSVLILPNLLTVEMEASAPSLKVGDDATLTADTTNRVRSDSRLEHFWFVEPQAGAFVKSSPTVDDGENTWRTASVLPGSVEAPPGNYIFSTFVVESVTANNVTAFLAFGSGRRALRVFARPVANRDVVPVTLRRTETMPTDDLPLWVVIKKSTDALAFENYNRFMDIVLCGKPARRSDKDKFDDGRSAFASLKDKRFLPYNDVEAYRLLKAATEAFVMVNCGVDLHNFAFDEFDIKEVISRVGVNLNTTELQDFWLRYLKDVNGEPDATLPYLALIREKLKDSPIKHAIFHDMLPTGLPQDCFGIIREKLTNPCLLELIWSYWHEEGMLVQSMNAIAMRFQNIRANTNGRDPLANLEVDPLRPLNNLFWGHIQDEQHRLSVTRRAYEYDHHYGISLYGKALANFRPADSRSQFLEAFHNLLHLTNIFFKEDDDTTMIADAFAVLNALKDVHLVLSEGAHNQFGDLPSTARIEMMMQQWLLARPEFLNFLPTRIMVAYPEPWMDRVDAMKKLQGWTDTSILHFRNMAIFGEQIILSVRYGSWSEVNNPVQAANWARFWRAEIQGYTHAYRAATTVDLTMDVHDVRDATQRSLPPSVHLRNRLSRQMQTA